MSAISDAITVTVPRRLLEHPEAFHIRRMRAAIWLYLVLLGRRGDRGDGIEVEYQELVRSMGLPEGTIRSWLGHLRKGRYIVMERLNGSVRVVLRDIAPRLSETSPVRSRLFTAEGLARALGERLDRAALVKALDVHSDGAIRRALAGALAVPERQIRRSRTALFLYLLKQNNHATKSEDHPRP